MGVINIQPESDVAPEWSMPSTHQCSLSLTSNSMINPHPSLSNSQPPPNDPTHDSELTARIKKSYALLSDDEDYLAARHQQVMAEQRQKKCSYLQAKIAKFNGYRERFEVVCNELTEIIVQLTSEFILDADQGKRRAIYQLARELSTLNRSIPQEVDAFLREYQPSLPKGYRKSIRRFSKVVRAYHQSIGSGDFHGNEDEAYERLNEVEEVLITVIEPLIIVCENEIERMEYDLS